MKDKQKLFDLQLTDKQLEQLKAHLERLDQQLSEVVAMRHALEEFKGLQGQEEVWVPVTNGVFASARLQSNAKVKVNVGGGVVVEKSVDQAVNMISTQLAQMAEYREQVLKQFHGLIEQAERLAKELQAQG